MNGDQEWFAEFFARYGGFTYACKVCGAMVAESHRRIHAEFHGKRQPPRRTPEANRER